MKNLLLNSVLFLMAGGAFAQLFVSPNGATTTYVYVNNQILYVDQDIRLLANSDFYKSANIYLRNEGQLIQGGSPGSLNSGGGYISVYQNTPDDDAYDYTYWCSPVNYDASYAYVLANPGNLNFGAYQFYDALNTTDSNQATIIPALNGVQTPMQISRRWLYTYTAPGGFVRFNETYAVLPGRGFTMKGLGVGNHDQLYDFRGRPNNGDIAVPVYAGPVGVGAETLSGNPYPSAMDIAQMFFEPGNEEIVSFQFWDENRTTDGHNYSDSYGGYGIWTPNSVSYDVSESNKGTYVAPAFFTYNPASVGTSQNGTGIYYDRRMSPIGQGFMIHTETAGSVLIENKFRRFKRESIFNDLSDFRTPDANISGGSIGGTTEPPSSPSISNFDPPPYLRIYTTFNDKYTRDMLLTFTPGATDSFDRGIDGAHPMDAPSDVYFPVMVNNSLAKYVINGVPFSTEKQVPITFVINTETNEIKVKVVIEHKMPVEHAYLFDSQNNAYHQITDGGVADLTLTPGIYENRFFIVFKDMSESHMANPATQLENQVLASVDFFQDNKLGELQVSNPEGYDIKNANIYDMGGKLVYNQKNIGNSTSFSFPTSNLSDGVYLVKLFTVDNVGIDYKMIVQNK